MSHENGLRVFSLRLPEKIAKQVDDRAKIFRRTRNAELTLLIEQGIDYAVQEDKRILDLRTPQAPAQVLGPAETYAGL